jgi:pyruvate/2-oxoglutarate dehydrogenase complex dihydrolipoamide dehydrogenase (E3) component/uncharacterized membrane protein YdjX (TVP38/TMEM64 family)
MSLLPERATAPARPLWRSPRLALAVLLAVLAGLIWAGGLGSLSLETLLAQQSRLLQWHAQSPWQARLAFAGVYVAVTALSLPGAALLSLACGAVLGLAWGTAVALLSATLGATLAMLMARYLLRPWVLRIGGARLAAFDRGMARDGVFYLLSMRLLPALPFFLINLAVGLTQMRALTFAWVSLLGMAPAALVYVHAGGALGQIRSPADIVSAPVLGALALLALLPWLMRWALPHWQRRRALAPWRAQRPRRFERNLVVIGGGAGGLVAAYMAAALRARVSLVEADRLGGDCLYHGCVPSKALIHVSRQLHQIGQSAHLGLRVAAPSVDWPVLMQRVREVIAQIEPHDSAQRYSALGVDVISGHARIVNPWTVEITGAGSIRRLSTRAIVIATGAQPVVPQWPGLADVDPVTSDTLWDRLAASAQIPQRIAICGGGAIGCELAQALARLGAHVTLIERGARLLAREDEDVSAVALKALQGAGVQVLLQTQPLDFGRDPECHARLQTPAGPLRLGFDLLLLALGRKPNLQGLGLQELGLSHLQLDAYLQTPIPGIYAAGDVTEQWQLTHAAAHQGWHAAVHALQGLRRFRADRAPMPQTLFLDPEIARVGLNEQQARGLAHEVTRFELAELDRAIIEGQREGYVKLITAAGSGKLLGATVVGPHAGELLAEYTLALQQGLSLRQLLAGVRAYPTWSEANKYAAGVFVRGRQPAWALRWLERYHAWRRG